MSSPPDRPIELGSAGSPTLTDEQFRRLSGYGTAEDVEVGDVLFAPGAGQVDLIVVERGLVALVRGATPDAPSEVVVRHGAGRFVGELNLLTGQRLFLTAVVEEAGRIHRVDPEHFRAIMDRETDLSDLLLRALLARRASLSVGGAARVLEIVGSDASAATLALRTYTARQRIPHVWVDSGTDDGRALIASAGLATADLPAVVTPAGVLRNATPGTLAVELGLSYRSPTTGRSDLTVVGAGPAGLAAAVYGASEGLSTVLVDAVGLGGQAAASSRIENYLGFPSGISGEDLASRAAVQALKFGAKLFSPCRVASLTETPDGPDLTLVDGTVIHTRAVVVATGAQYKALPLPRWPDFEGAGIFYAATEIEARGCAGQPVVVIGGANSAGQAALFLARRGCDVTLVVRGSSIAADMSSYLVDRVCTDPHVTVRTGTEVAALHGEQALDRVTLRTGTVREDIACDALFCFIGAEPATTWLAGVALDDDGFVRTDVQLHDADLDDRWSVLHRAPLPYETNLPAVFAVGDVRSGSMKRVASAVGEGAAAVHSVHRAIAPPA